MLPTTSPNSGNMGEAETSAKPTSISKAQKAAKDRVIKSRTAAFPPATSGFMIFLLVLSGLASLAALGIGIYWVLEIDEVNRTEVLAFVSIGPLVVGAVGLVLAYFGCFTICHQHCRTHCCVVTLLLVCAIILLVAAGIFSLQYAQLNTIAFTDSYRLPASAQPTNDQTIAWYNKCCGIFDVIPAPSCDSVITAPDPTRACIPGTPYVSQRCGCYVDAERYANFFNSTTVDHCRRLGGVNRFGTALVGPPSQYGCGGIAYFNGTDLVFTGIAKQFQAQLFSFTSQIIFPTFIGLFSASACFLLVVVVHLGFLIAAPFGEEAKAVDSHFDEENPAQPEGANVEKVEKPIEGVSEEKEGTSGQGSEPADESKSKEAQAPQESENVEKVGNETEPTTSTGEKDSANVDQAKDAQVGQQKDNREEGEESETDTIRSHVSEAS